LGAAFNGGQFWKLQVFFFFFFFMGVKRSIAFY
jgi:hypothetical protein